jgi:hypothetical protein
VQPLAEHLDERVPGAGSGEGVHVEGRDVEVLGSAPPGLPVGEAERSERRSPVEGSRGIEDWYGIATCDTRRQRPSKRRSV